jgi:hypothetical protein
MPSPRGEVRKSTCTVRAATRNSAMPQAGMKTVTAQSRGARASGSPWGCSPPSSLPLCGSVMTGGGNKPTIIWQTTPSFRVCICAHVHMCDRSLVYKITHIPANPYAFILVQVCPCSRVHTFTPSHAQVLFRHAFMASQTDRLSRPSCRYGLNTFTGAQMHVFTIFLTTNLTAQSNSFILIHV